MDPITIIGLAASVVQLVNAAKKVLDVIKSFKDGDKELTTLAHDLSAFTEALISFDRILRSKHTLHRISGPVLENMLGHSKELVQELEAHITRLGSSSLSTIRRAKWVQHKSSINRLHTKLKEKNIMLHTFLSITHAETFIAITSQFPSFMISQPTETTETTMTQIGDDEPANNLSNLQLYNIGVRPRKNSNNSNVTSCNTSDTTSLMERLSIVGSINSMESSTSWGSSGSAFEPTPDPIEPANQALASTGMAHGSNRQLLFQDMFVTRKSCQYKCHCKCHEEPAAKPRRRRFVGYQGGSKNLTTQCTDPACMGNEALEDAAEQHSLSFRKVLSSVISAKSVEVRYNLGTFRMVPEGSDAMRYVKQGNLDKLKACIESGEATIWDTAPDGWSFLHAATYNKQVGIVKYLLELGVATESGDIGTRIPADFAVLKSIGKDATENEKKLLELFGKKNDVLADFEFTPIHTAVLDLYSYDDRERPSLEELIQLTDEANNAPIATNWAQWKLKYRGRSPLFSAILEYFRASAFERPKAKIIHNLIDQKDKKYHWTPLHWAASSGRVKEMHILMDYGADPVLLSNLGANIIHAAVESKFDSGLVTALKIWKRYSNQININQVNIWGETAVHVASCLSASCVKLLLDAGADPSTQDENGQVALHFAGLSAQSTERSKVVSVLCNTRNTTHINIRDYNSRPPLFDFLDDAYCVEILLRHGAKVDITDDSGQNAFHHACINGEDASLQVMLKLSDCSSAAISTDNNGNTPLIEALSNSHVECAMTLLTQLEDVGPQIGKDGWAPIHYAAKIGEPDLLKRVCQHSSFKKLAKTLDGKRASIVAMEAGTWNGRIKDLIREHDCIDWVD